MQDTNSLLFALLAIAIAIAGTAIAARWRYGRERHRLEHRLGKANADRDALHEQVKKAREQVAQLQKELTARRSPAASDATRPPAAKPTAAPAPAPAMSRAELLLFEAPQTAAHGFADTQPFSESSFQAQRARH